LKEARLLLVFLSPAALRSNWVLFEAGHAYARGVRVVPVGIRGVNLSTVPPPMSLLQGFNITSAESLTNIFALTNEEFGFSHNATFIREDFEGVFPPDATSPSPAQPVFDVVDTVALTFQLRENLRKGEYNPLRVLNDALLTHDLPAVISDDMI